MITMENLITLLNLAFIDYLFKGLQIKDYLHQAIYFIATCNFGSKAIIAMGIQFVVDRVNCNMNHLSFLEQMFCIE